MPGGSSAPRGLSSVARPRFRLPPGGDPNSPMHATRSSRKTRRGADETRAVRGEDEHEPSERKGASMTRSRPLGLLTAAALVPIVALAAAGCGSSNGGTSTAAAKAPSGSSATVRVASTGLGKILVDSQGRTLYLFQKDSGTKSTCSGGCATAWPPLRASHKPT